MLQLWWKVQSREHHSHHPATWRIRRGWTLRSWCCTTWEEIKVVFKDTNVARVHKDTESTKDPKVKVFRNMRRTFVSRDFFPGTMITLSILINVFLQIFFPFYKNEEWFVFHVDTKRLPIIEALFCKTSALSFEDRSRLGKSIMGCLLKAMKDCGFTVKQYGDCRFTVTVTELEFKDSAPQRSWVLLRTSLLSWTTMPRNWKRVTRLVYSPLYLDMMYKKFHTTGWKLTRLLFFQFAELAGTLQEVDSGIPCLSHWK